jgi:hypothetical protein
MENNDFKVRIIDFYKDVDKPIINNLYEDNLGKNILEFSTNNKMQILKKNKNTWKIKDQRKLLNELESVKKKKIKILKDSFNNFNDSAIEEIKKKNNKCISEIETITDLKKNLENKDNYLKLKNLSLLGTNTKKKNLIGGSIHSNTLKIIDINNNEEIHLKIDNLFSSSESEEFIEIFSN